MEARYQEKSFDLVVRRIKMVADYELKPQYTKEMKDRDILLVAVQRIYRKCCLNDPNIEDQELNDVLLHSLCQTMTFEGFQSWLYIAKKNIEESRR